VFDRLTILVQQVAEKTSRALTVGISSGASSELPSPVANNLIGWDTLGTSIINYAGVASAAVSAAMAPIVSAATMAAARVGLGAAASGANTDITSLASPALGSATATTQAAGDNSTAIATTAFVQASGDLRYAGAMPNFTASTISNLISASLGIGKVDFRNAVLTNGTPVEYNVTSTLTLAMNSTAASLGATTAVATSIIYAIVYNAGVPQLAVCNIHGGLQLDETNLITTTAIGSGSTSANVWYSTSAIATASQYRIIGLVNATWTSGTGWSSPALVQPVSETVSTLLSSKFTSSLGTNGWKKYPDASSPTGYFIEQWGATSIAVTANTATAISWVYPISFPTAVITALAKNQNYVGSDATAESTSLTTASGFCQYVSAVTVSIQWRVIGY
jgi:hypothetical protein